jgi:hypothetical protein
MERYVMAKCMYLVGFAAVTGAVVHALGVKIDEHNGRSTAVDLL